MSTSAYPACWHLPRTFTREQFNSKLDQNQLTLGQNQLAMQHLAVQENKQEALDKMNEARSTLTLHPLHVPARACTHRHPLHPLHPHLYNSDPTPLHTTCWH